MADENTFMEERRNRILSILRDRKRVTVRELARLFDISEVTIRQDLNDLSLLGSVLRTHGGAVYIEKGGSELSYPLRKQKQRKEKEAIGRVASRLVKDGEVIFLDASTTAAFILPFLKDRQEITVVTNSMETARQAFMELNATVILTGGRIRRDTLSLVGSSLSCVLPEGNISKAFLGAWGISLKDGFTDVNPEEIRVKREALERAGRILILVDSTKWGRVSFQTFANLSEVDTIISDTGAPAEMVDAVKEKGCQVILAK